jgi:hypothetical protein
MSRVVFEKGQQQAYLTAVKEALGGRWETLAKRCGVHPRTIRDWHREKYLMNNEAVILLQENSGVTCPVILDLRYEYWSTSKAGRVGARRRQERYGNPGTAEGRRRGGFTSYEQFRLSSVPTGFQLRREILKPMHSPQLAEFVGIVLGDGGIASRQVTITLNAVTDKLYADFVVREIGLLFGLTPSRYTRKNACIIVVSSVELVEFLLGEGLVKGDKVEHQVALPAWILEDPCYMKACLRGLVDTDGSVYLSNHMIKGTRYHHACMCFRNYSNPLVESVHRILAGLGYHPTRGRNRVYLYRQRDIQRYFNDVGTHNPKHLKRYQAMACAFFPSAITRPVQGRGAGVVITGRS